MIYHLFNLFPPLTWDSLCKDYASFCPHAYLLLQNHVQKQIDGGVVLKYDGIHRDITCAYIVLELSGVCIYLNTM